MNTFKLTIFHFRLRICFASKFFFLVTVQETVLSPLKVYHVFMRALSIVCNLAAAINVNCFNGSICSETNLRLYFVRLNDDV